jgi:Holliday junction resolvase RusA-like endonuclease
VKIVDEQVTDDNLGRSRKSVPDAEEREGKSESAILIEIGGEPISGSQLKFNRQTGHAFRPKEHKQRVFTIFEYANNTLEERGLKRPLFSKGIPLKLSVEFYFPYRQQDYGTGRNAGVLKPSAPKYMEGRKDIDNLLKPLKDGLKGVMYVDDKQIVEYGRMVKLYSETPRTIIYVEEIDG